MGSSKPTVVTPPPPKVFRSENPAEAYMATADYLNRIQRQTNEAQKQLYAQSGTPGEIGARLAGTRLQSAGSYLSSLPSGDRYTRQTGSSIDYEGAKAAAQQDYSQAQDAYAIALEKAKQAPPPAYTDEEINERPSWAKSMNLEGVSKTV